jgi:hypothetical protein
MIDLSLLSEQDNEKILSCYDKIKNNDNNNEYVKEIDKILNKNFRI